MAEEKMPWTQLWSPDMNATMRTFLFSAIPTLYLIDKDGKIVGSYTGYGESVENKVKAWFDKN